MATRTSVGDGLWSAVGTWDTGVPVDGDDAVIDVGHTVTFDVDQSAWVAGLAGLAINGTLRFITDGTVTCLNMSANITGAGTLYVGNSRVDPVPAVAGGGPTALLRFTNDAVIDVTGAAYMFGVEREPAYAIANKPDATHLVLAGVGALPWLIPGDRIVWSCDAATIYDAGITDYDPATRTITLSGAVANPVNTSGATDHAAVISRSIRVIAVGVADGYGGFNWQDIPIEIRGVLFEAWTYGALCAAPSAPNTAVISHCATYNCKDAADENGGIAADMATGTIDKCVAYGSSLATWLQGMDITDSYCFLGMGGSYGFGGSCIGTTFTSCWGFFDAYRNMAGSRSCICIDCGFMRMPGPQGHDHIAIGCHIAGPSSASTGQSNVSGRRFINCVMDHSLVADISPRGSMTLINCLLNSATPIQLPVANYCSSDKALVIESFDHQQVPGAYRNWTAGGSVETDAAVHVPGRPVSYKHACVDALYRAWQRRRVTAEPGDVLRVRGAIHKDALMAYLPRVWIADPASDPLMDAANVPLAEAIGTDVLNTWEPFGLSWRNQASYAREVYVYTVAKNANGNAWFDIDISVSR